LYARAVCPCGSGKKYKKCCLPQDMAQQRDQALQQQAERKERAAAQRAAVPRGSLFDALARRPIDPGDDPAYELTAASNAAADLVHGGKLDEAERAAHDLLERFLEVHDGWDRLGMACEARGDKKMPPSATAKVIDFIRAYPDNYDDGFDRVFVELVDRLDPAAH